MKLKSNKGIGLSDTIIAMAIFVFFSGLVITLSYNIYLQSNFIKRNDTATNYIVEVFEYAKSINFNSVNKNSLITYINSTIKSTNPNVNVLQDNSSAIRTGYSFLVDVDDLESEYEEQLLKRIDITVYYKLGSKIKNVSMSTLINK